MTLVIERSALLPALAEASRAVEKRSTIPILSNLRLAAGPDGLAITGTDLDVEITAHAPCRKAGPASSFTLPAATFHDAVRKMPEGVEISIASDGAAATVSGGRTRFRIPILPSADFPVMSGGEPTHRFTLEPATLAKILATTAFAISTEETRYYLGGIYLHADEMDGEEKLVAVATDGHRLARLAQGLPEGATGTPGVIVPRRTVGLLKAFADGKTPVAVSLSASRIRFEIERDGQTALALTSKLVDGTFPDYKRVIPAGNAHRYTAGREDLFKAVDRVVTIAASAKSSAVKFTFGDGDTLKLATVNPDTGSAEDELSLSSSAGTEIEIGFNGRYCLDMLAATEAGSVTFALEGGGSPAVVTPQGDPAATFVIMPMRV